jgi:hypothetical protein
MNKKTFLYAGILGALVLVITLTINSKQTATIKQELRDFAVDDTSSVNKIFLADMRGVTSTLEKKDGGWIVNGKYPVSESRIQTLLMTIKRLDVKHPVAIAAKENVLRELSAEGVKVEIFSNDKKIKTYYVGGTTPSEEGTYMMLENSSAPFVVHIPGFRGYLNSRYFTEERDWRTRQLFVYHPSEVKEIKVEYTQQPQHSFSLKARDAHGNFEVSPLGPSRALIPDDLLLKSYVVGLRTQHFEDFVHPGSGIKADSVFATSPIALVEVTTANEIRKLRVYNRLADRSSKGIENILDIQENPVIDPEKLLVIFEDRPHELMQVQYLTFGNLLRKYQDFAENK